MVPVGTLITERPERVVLYIRSRGVVASIVALAVVSPQSYLGMRAAMACKSPEWREDESQRISFGIWSGSIGHAGLYRKVGPQPFEPPLGHRLPAADADYQRAKSYVEGVPIQQYH